MKLKNAVSLTECVNYLQPSPYIVQSTNYEEMGIPVLTPGKTFILGYTNEKTGIFSGPFPVIIFDDFTTASKLVDFPFKVKSSAMKILLPKNNVDIKYIFYFLQVKKFTAQTHKRYWISVCSKTKISLPPLPEQKRIVKKIEELFAGIDKNIKQLEQTQQALIQYRQSVLQQAFSGKLHKTTNWKDRCFSDLCTYIQRGKSPKYIMQSVLPVINQRCIRWNELQLQYLKFIDPAQFSSWTSERHLQPMDILWNSTGTGTIGRAYLYKGTELSDAVVDSHVTILRVNAKEVYARFLFLYIQSPLVQNRIEKIQSGSTNQVELARKEIQAITIPLPSLPEQKAIVAKIEKAFASTDKAQAAISAALQQAKQLKQSILKRAFEGKLVPQDPNDKPVDLSQLKPHKGKTK